jgi:hypothetical protein
MFVGVLILTLLAAQLNLTALVPAAPGQAPPPWWVGGGVLWPFFADTRTLIPPGGALDTLTPLLGIVSGGLFLMAAAALLGWWVPSSWFPVLVVGGVLASIALQIVWLSMWAILPLVVDAALVWLVLGMGVTAVTLRS